MYSMNTISKIQKREFPITELDSPSCIPQRPSLSLLSPPLSLDTPPSPHPILHPHKTPPCSAPAMSRPCQSHRLKMTLGDWDRGSGFCQGVLDTAAVYVTGHGLF